MEGVGEAIRAFIIILIIVICSIIGIGIYKEHKIKENYYNKGYNQAIMDKGSSNPIIDSLTIEIDNLHNKIDSIQFVNDSIINIKNSLDEEIFVANYKLIRIKEYNEIAAKGNNIKYLRGWINRTLEE